VASFRGLVGRVRGDQLAALSAEVAATRAVVLDINHVVANLNHVVTQLDHVVQQLNDDIRSGAERSLPLFLGYVERLRLDADTAVGAAQVIERQLALLDERLAAADGTAPDRS
jgi:uncharacterized coiled-coil protein SlyX